jgi:energy-converting hydrogenase Eha subunit A
MNEINKELRGRTFGYISAALGLVAGLAWNEAISAMIDAIFPLSKDTVWVKFLYAIIVTVAVVILIKYLDRMFNRPEPAK